MQCESAAGEDVEFSFEDFQLEGRDSSLEQQPDRGMRNIEAVMLLKLPFPVSAVNGMAIAGKQQSRYPAEDIELKRWKHLGFPAML